MWGSVERACPRAAPLVSKCLIQPVEVVSTRRRNSIRSCVDSAHGRAFGRDAFLTFADECLEFHHTAHHNLVLTAVHTQSTLLGLGGRERLRMTRRTNPKITPTLISTPCRDFYHSYLRCSLESCCYASLPSENNYPTPSTFRLNDSIAIARIQTRLTVPRSREDSFAIDSKEGQQPVTSAHFPLPTIEAA